jgi:hypothetical protein
MLNRLLSDEEDHLGVLLAGKSEIPNHQGQRIENRVTIAGPTKPKRKIFSIFRSAAEEAHMKTDEQSWDNEGGHMSCTSGRIVSIRGDMPFKVVMSREAGEKSEHLFATMREAEAFIRRNTPRPPERGTNYDRESP